MGTKSGMSGERSLETRIQAKRHKGPAQYVPPRPDRPLATMVWKKNECKGFITSFINSEHIVALLSEPYTGKGIEVRAVFCHAEKSLEKNFKMKDFGTIRHCLGMRVVCNKDSVTLDQEGTSNTPMEYNESVCGDEHDKEEREDQPNPLVLGDFIGEVQANDYDSFDSDDDLPLSNLREPNIEHSNRPTVALQWKKNYRTNIPGEFTEDVGKTDQVLMMENVTPLSLFHLFWTEHLQDILCFQNNLYATQSGKPFTTTTEELDAFIALNLVVGIKKLPSHRDYWSSAPNLHDSFVTDSVGF
ncbi:unnamed protein product [Danaus chrysippus]|uniref:(African queen) hypothetical protein n=1 Tax=Danaus chrysippus TaxID=151541 RepID=A0A8J2QYU4_9NEOP|nr:unnamed protein product [Danaus chrysippus]